MKYVVYRSFAADPREVSPDVAGIVAESVKNNPSLQITGFLHFEWGRYYQYVEGPAPAVNDLISRIREDRRNYGLDVRGTGEVTARLFPDFDMGFAGGSGRFLRPAGVSPGNRPDANEIVEFLLSLRGALLAVRPCGG